ncbi:hypothetical protein CAEBREN_21316 [Caenorhabditis brenneri]|uniref:Uncharacterized protein n=1 Tax=Caenorhabditis brenneri TaxID=135651 RepID=G0PBT4_CAEBE|nr:hypothetical protein CAEBREN_21316 [Caenorhabditis brenneri]
MSGRRSVVNEPYNHAEREGGTHQIVDVQQYRRVCNKAAALNNRVKELEDLLVKTNEAHGVVTAGLEAEKKKILDENALFKTCIEDGDRKMKRTVEQHNIETDQLKLDKNKAIHEKNLLEDEVLVMKREQGSQSAGVEEKKEKVRLLEIDKMALEHQLEQKTKESKRMKDEYEKRGASWNSEKEDMLKERQALLEMLKEVREENVLLTEDKDALANQMVSLIRKYNVLEDEKETLIIEKQKLHQAKLMVVKEKEDMNVVKRKLEDELAQQKEYVSRIMEETNDLRKAEKTVGDQKMVIEKLELEKEELGRKYRRAVDSYQEREKIMVETIKSLQPSVQKGSKDNQRNEAEENASSIKNKTVELANTVNYPTSPPGIKRPHDGNGNEKLSFKFMKNDTKINEVKSPFASTKKENRSIRTTPCTREEFDELEDDIWSDMGMAPKKQ